MEVHKKMYGFTNRDVSGLRRKFNAMVKKPAPTGDPTIPAEIRVAKELQQLIRHRAEVQVGDDKTTTEEEEDG